MWSSSAGCTLILLLGLPLEPREVLVVVHVPLVLFHLRQSFKHVATLVTAVVKTLLLVLLLCPLLVTNWWIDRMLGTHVLL